MSTQLAEPTYIGDLGDGLIRRWSTKADQEKIGQLMGSVYRPSADAPFNSRGADEPRIFMSEGFPFMEPGDIAIVEDTSKPERPVIACTCLWRHQWSYGGIPFGVGRPENVATDPAYRNRGLVRTLMEMVHARSTAQGDLAQAITGIEYFYRQFGYEYVLDLGGHRTANVAAIPAKKGDEPEPYTLRLATVEDAPALVDLYNLRRAASLVWHEASADYWRFHIASWDDPVVREQGATRVGLHGRLHMIIDSAGRIAGYTWLAAKRWQSDLEVYALQLASQLNWQAALPTLLRAFRDQGQQAPAANPDTEPFSKISFHLGRAHPVYELLGESLAPSYEPPYAWYLRVPDVLAFLQQIAPVLETRLAHSILASYSGELKFNFYRSGLRLQFEAGKLVTIEPWRVALYDGDAHAGCPPLIFLQLLFGYRSMAELHAIFPDVWAGQEAALLVDTLFPKQPSVVYSLSLT